MTLTPGQQWISHNQSGQAQSKMVIGAIANCGQHGRIICCTIVSDDPTNKDTSISFLPMTENAFLESITSQDGTGDLAEGFAGALETWKSDPRGLSVFTVPFKGSLNRLIADQMTAVSKQNAA